MGGWGEERHVLNPSLPKRGLHFEVSEVGLDMGRGAGGRGGGRESHGLNLSFPEGG